MEAGEGGEGGLAVLVGQGRVVGVGAQRVGGGAERGAGDAEDLEVGGRVIDGEAGAVGLEKGEVVLDGGPRAGELGLAALSRLYAFAGDAA